MHKIIIVIVLFIPSLCIGQRVIEVDFQSKVLHENRKLWISLPDNYNLRKDKYHLVVLLDGDNRSLFNYAVAAKRFIEDNSVDLYDFNAPESIVVGIEQKDRAIDFKKNAPEFLSFLKKEVLPYVDTHFRTVNYRVLIGHSLAGAFALYAFQEDPKLFNAIIAASPAYTANYTGRVLTKIDSILQTGLKRDMAIYVSTTYLKNDQTEEQFRNFAENMALHYSNKGINNFRFRFSSSASLGHGKSPYFAIPEGLHFVYNPKLWQLDADSLTDQHKEATAVYGRYEMNIMERFGVPQPMGGYTGLIALQVQRRGSIAEAVGLLKKQVNNNPANLDLFAQLLGLLKRQSLPDYSTYKARFIAVMNQLKTPAQDKKDYLHQIETSQ